MLIDSPQVVEGSAIQNTTVANGATFPTTLSTGELFYLSTAAQGFAVGLYSSDGQTWSPVSSGAATSVVVKPRPLSARALAGSNNFGSSADHNLHYRGILGTNMLITVQPDSFWGGSQEYWENDFSPTTPAAMPVGGSAVFGKHGSGDLIFAAGPGVTINTPDTLFVTRLHGKVTLIKVAPNTWDLEGNLAAA